MTTESLIIELDARTQKLDAALKKSNERIDKLSDSTKKADNSLAKMAKSGAAAGVAIATGAALAATAISAMVLASANSVREMELLSKQANLTVSEFSSLAFATKQYGVDAEQVADISKDLTDKLGEFSAAGTGAFQDFVDVVGLSKSEAIALATEFESMSSDQVLGQMVSMMENAGASSNQMTFAMESIGNEASRLIPLFANQSKELIALRSGYDKINSSLALTKEQQTALTDTAKDWDSLTTAMGNSANLISATLAPTLSTFINSVIEVVPQATRVIVDFINSFKTPEQINDIISVQNQLADATEQLRIENEHLTKAQNTLTEAQENNNNRTKNSAIRRISERTEKIKELESAIISLTAREEELTSANTISAPTNESEGGDITGVSSGGEDVYTGTDGAETSKADAQTQVDAFAESLALKAQLLTDAGDTEFEILTAQKEREENYLQEQREKGLLNEEEYLKSKQNLEKIYNNAQVKSGKETFETLLSSGATQSKKMFELNKLYTASQVAMKIPEAVQNSYAWGSALGGPVGGAAAAAVAFSASALQLKSVMSQSYGGSSSASAPSSSGSVSIPETQAATPTVDVETFDTSTGLSNSVTLKLDDGTELASGLLEGQTNALSDGRGDLF